MKLQQRRAKRKSDGAAVVYVDEEGELWYADEQGGKTTWQEVEAAQFHEIRDGEAVTEAGQLRVRIWCDLV